MKKFIKKLCFFVSLLLALALILLLIEKMFFINSGGDLNRLGRIPIRADYRDSFHLNNKIHFSYLSDIDFKKPNIDILVFGDSFSEKSGTGPSETFTNYLGMKNNKKIVLSNLKTVTNQSLNHLLNGDFFELINVKYVILQVIVRHITSLHDVDNSEYVNVSHLDSSSNIFKKFVRDEDSPISIRGYLTKAIESLNNSMYFNLYSILYNFDDNAFFSKVYKFKIDDYLFSTKKNELLVYDDDIKTINLVKKNIIDVNTYLNELNEKLLKKNIKLIFFPIPDKYDFYYNKISKKKYPPNEFFELFEKVSKNYIYIDSKKILTPFLNDGMMDLYLADDTHWSYKASEIVSDYIISRIY
jgi:hypothetical protein